MALRAAYAIAAASGLAAADYISASDPRVQWSGRPNFNPDGSVSFDFQSTAAHFTVAGVGAAVTLHANVTLAPGQTTRLATYIRDYEAQNMLLSTGTNTYLVAAGLTYNTSNITLAYALEPQMAGADAPSGRFVTFIGFETSFGGTFVQPDSGIQRRIDIIGDSITAGSGYDKIESVNGQMSLETGCNPWAPSYGNSQAFNWESYMCRYLRANCTTVAWSGGTLLRLPACAGRGYLPGLYTQAFASDTSSRWDFSRQTRPDAVIVFLGTNDFACGATTPTFAAGALQLVQNITQYYASSPLNKPGQGPIQFFLVIGPMSPNAPLPGLTLAIANANAAGLKASLLDMRNATLDGCGGHPGPIGHWQMAVEVVPQIQAFMGW